MKRLIAILLLIAGCMTAEHDAPYPHNGEAWRLVIQQMEYASTSVNDMETFNAFLVSFQDEVKMYDSNEAFNLEYNTLVHNIRLRLRQ